MNLEFHHIGVACRSIEKAATAYLQTGYAVERAAFEDPVQGVRGLFLVGGGPRLELLEPLPGSSMLDAFLGLQPRMYHLAYEVADLEGAISGMRENGAKLMSASQPAVAFGGRRIAFVMLPNRALTELISTV